MRGNRKSQSGVHARTVALDRGVDEILQPRESNDFVEFLFDLVPAHPQNGAIEKDVLPPGQIGVKSGSHFDQGGKLPVDPQLALGGFHDAAEVFENGALPGPVMPDDADRLAPAHLKANVLQRPEFPLLQLRSALAFQHLPRQRGNQVAQGIV